MFSGNNKGLMNFFQFRIELVIPKINKHLLKPIILNEQDNEVEECLLPSYTLTYNSKQSRWCMYVNKSKMLLKLPLYVALLNNVLIKT